MKQKKGYVYTVRGQHDGTIGVYTSIIRAFNAANDYVTTKENKGTGVMSCITKVRRKLSYSTATYQKARISLAKINRADLYDSPEEETTAVIEKFLLDA